MTSVLRLALATVMTMLALTSEHALIGPARAAVTQGWAQRYSQSSQTDDFGEYVKFAPSGEVVVVGNSRTQLGGPSGSYIAKHQAANGELVWERKSDFQTTRDIFSNVAVDSGGNIVIPGTSPAGFFLGKYSGNDGRVLWEKRWSVAGLGDSLSDAAIDQSDDILVSGTHIVSAHPQQLVEIACYVAKVSGTDGRVIWEKRYGIESDLGAAVDLAVDKDGDVVFLAQSSTNASACFAAKLASDGSVVWTRKLAVFPVGLALDSEGNPAVVGQGATPDGGREHFYTAKLSGDSGVVRWEHIFDGVGTGNAKGVAVDLNGNVLITGAIGDSSHDFYTAKYSNADGTLLWQKTHNGSRGGADAPHAIMVDSYGNAYVAGRSEPLALSPDIRSGTLIKFAAADGSLLWEQRYGGRDEQDDRTANFLALAIDSHGAIAVVGTTQPQESYGNYDMLTLLYREDVAPRLTYQLVDNALRFSWPAEKIGAVLESKVISTESPSSWVILPGSSLTNHVSVPLVQKAALFRMAFP